MIVGIGIVVFVLIAICMLVYRYKKKRMPAQIQEKAVEAGETWGGAPECSDHIVVRSACSFPET